ncbi:DUF2500 domain-containing protein [Paenisporosarcina cavernae]|uniref:DUF2500 domain-containing protein n=1 Tax=Paenisporosarcina cavernae TaxID=2320858 RepID=A0A385YXY1_9BACL|nr:DUF2500 domain-containing protein [Paenisporosarcina cavernae]AYC30403.1 DUF2500 domain-containing protein [Paenisporosarcina cavernae]
MPFEQFGDPYSSGGFDVFSLFSIIFPLFFLVVFGIILFAIIKGISQWSKNNRSPILTVPAEVVTKRTKTSGGTGDSAASTRYFVTFEVQSGDRMELQLSGQEFGMLADDDIGLLTFQGTRYKSFERKKSN